MHRAFVWKLRRDFKSHIRPEVVADAAPGHKKTQGWPSQVADVHTSVTELQRLHVGFKKMEYLDLR